MSDDIIFYNRAKQQDEIEKVYGGAGINFLYKNSFGKLLRIFFKHPIFSKIYGWFQSHPLSSKKVPSFVEKFEIPMADYLAGSVSSKEKINSYKSFNEFFIRKFVDGKRDFVAENHIMPAFSEARYYGWSSISDDMTFPVKGVYLNAESLLGSLGSEWIDTFQDGPLLLARLCPVDYHRYHYPDNGCLIESSREGSELESVNPIALAEKPEIFLKNERMVSILETQSFGKLAYIEVGATCVGKIIQSHKESEFKRGNEKGYFLFGGSTVIVLGESGKWKPSQDIIERTSNQQEVLIRLGQEVASLITKDN